MSHHFFSARAASLPRVPRALARAIWWLALLVFLAVAGTFFLRYRGSGFFGKMAKWSLL